jgi:glycosyltransferase 2 family protein
MTRLRRLFKPLLAACIIACAGFFFFKAFERNWASIRAQDFKIEPAFLVASALCLGATALLGTYGWYTAINGLSTSKINFRQSVAVNNSSSLTKYIPGKVWSYALQLYWLDRRGFSKPLIVYVNLINLLVSMATTVLLGLACLIVSGTQTFPRALLVAAFLGLLLVDAASILFNHALLNGLTSLINRLFKRSVGNFEVKKALLVRLHVIHFVAAIVSGLGAYLFCFAIGYRIDLDRTLVVIGSTLVSDVIGFLAIVVPGGLGVREGLMYAILGGQATGSLSLILPVGSRMLSMLMDVVLGGVAFKLLSTLGPSKPAQA